MAIQGALRGDDYSRLSEEQFSKVLNKRQVSASRQQQMNDISRKLWNNTPIDTPTKSFGATASAVTGANGTNGTNGINAGTTASDARTSLMQSAKDLAEQQLGHSLTLMGKSSDYRSKEAEQGYGHRLGENAQNFDFDTRKGDQNFSFETRKADQDFGHRTKEAEQNFDFRTRGADQDSGLRMREGDQQFSFRTKGAEQDSGLRMREADQSNVFQRNLQKDNNDVRERMQGAGFGQEKEMFNMKDAADSERTRKNAMRAAATYRGNF